MPWSVKSVMEQQQEFVLQAMNKQESMSTLCQRYGISRKTGYKWLARYEESGADGLQPRSRRPKTSPTHSSTEVESAILAVREQHPAWGARKIKAFLEQQADTTKPLPATSTVNDILRRNGYISKESSVKHTAWQRFEHEAPNDLWQMDFKGHFALADQSRCYPLTILDDHSRFSLCLQACANEQRHTVQAHLIETFRRYGLPLRMTMDNGNPWGHSLRSLRLAIASKDLRSGGGTYLPPPTPPKSILTRSYF